jgi:hypothetical protein
MKDALSITILVAVLSAGYLSADVMAQVQKLPIEYVQSLDQARDILKPQGKPLIITKDPFKPIIMPAKKGIIAKPVDILSDVKVLGIVKLDDDYRAFIRVGTKERVVSLQDTVRKFTIIDINMEQVVFKSGNRTVIKKRGKL